VTFVIAMNAKNHNWLIECASIINAHNAYYKRRKQKLVALAIILMKKQKKERYKEKQFWVAPLFQKRCDHGFYHALLPTLRLEDLRFHNYFRMTTTQFENLLEIVWSHLQKLYVVREPINPAERLSLTLR